MNISEYRASIKKEIDRGNYTEYSFRAYLQALLSDFSSDYEVTHEPRRQSCHAPYYIITKKWASGNSMGDMTEGRNLAILEAWKTKNSMRSY
ncbi:MAG: hypothetical protein BWX81_02133 [Spirochaetes bacterium ADurb.Bin110]|nr:MAG: hypothetical protein BWX81_02133 [Spirochaetes bacterium ADurb.Bin110]